MGFPNIPSGEVPSCGRFVINNYLFTSQLLFGWLSGWATRHASREASGVPRRIKVERRRQIQETARRLAGCWKWDLEAVGCLLP
jgi:hypothetical protein